MYFKNALKTDTVKPVFDCLIQVPQNRGNTKNDKELVQKYY